MSRGGRTALRVLAWTGVSLLGLVMLVAGAVVVVGHTNWGRSKLLAVLLPVIQKQLTGTLRIGRLGGNLTEMLVLEDVTLQDAEGKEAVRAARVAVQYNLLALVWKTIHLTDVRAQGVQVSARYLADGRMNLAALVKPSDTPQQKAAKKFPFTIRIGDLGLDAQGHYDGTRPGQEPGLFDHVGASLHLAARAKIADNLVDASLKDLSLTTQAPLAASLTAGGEMQMRDGKMAVKNVSLSVHADAEELRRLLPEGLRQIRGSYVVDAHMSGPLEALGVTVALLLPAGRVDVGATLAASQKDLPWQVKVSAEGIDPAAAWAGAPHGEIALAAGGQGHLATGTVDLERLLVKVVDLQATARGRFGLDGAADAWLDVEDRDLSRLSRLGVAGIPDLGGALTVHAHAVRTAPHLKLDAEARGRDLRVQTVARVRHLEVRVHSVDLGGEASVDMKGLRAAGFAFDTLVLRARGDRDTADLHVDGHGPYATAFLLNVHGKPRQLGERPVAIDAALNQLMLSSHGWRWQTPHPAYIHVGDDVSVRRFEVASGPQVLKLDGRYGLKTKAVEATLSARKIDVLRIAQLLNVKQKLPHTTLDLQAKARGTVSAPVAEVSLQGTSDKEERLGLDPMTLGLRAHYQATQVRGDVVVKSSTASGPNLNARFDVPVSAARGRKLSAEVAADAQIQRYARFLPPQLATLKGKVALNVRAGGSLREPELDAVVNVPSWDLDQMKHSSTQLNVKYSEAGLSAKLSAKVAPGKGGPAASADVSVSAPVDLGLSAKKTSLERVAWDTPISLKGAIHGDMEKLRAASALIETHAPLTQGVIDATVSASGTLSNPMLSVQVNGRKLQSDAISRADVGLMLQYKDSRARVRLDAALSGQRALSANGQTTIELKRILGGASLKDSPLYLDLFIPGFELSRATQFHGMVVANVAARGTFAVPKVGVQISIDRLGAPGANIGDLRLQGRMNLNGDQASAQMDIIEQKGGLLHLDAAVPLHGDLPMNVKAQAKDFLVDYRSATGVGGLRQLHALLNTDVSVTGTRGQPHMAGSVRLSDGSFALAADPTAYDQIQLLATIDDKGLVTLKQLSAHSGDGKVQASGSAQLKGLKPQSFQASVQANHFPSLAGNTGFWLDAHAHASGKMTGNDLRADITVDRAMVRLPKLAAGKKLQPLTPLPDVRYVDARAQVQAAAKQAAQEAVQNGDLSKITIGAHLPNPVFVRSQEANASLQGDLQVQLAGPDVIMNGSIYVLDGWVDLLGKRYDIDRARVGFGGEPEPDPDLDIRVSRRITNATIILQVQGSALKPEITMLSEPPIYDESQIIAIILTGDPEAQQYSDQSIQQKAVGAISGLIVGQLKDKLASKLPIDVLKVDLGGSGYGFNQTRLEIGKYLSENLYLSYVHQFGNTQGLRKLNANQAYLEYRFLRQFEMQTMFGDAGVGSFDLFWARHF